MSTPGELLEDPLASASDDDQVQRAAGAVGDDAIGRSFAPPADEVVSRLWWLLLRYVPERFVLAASPDQVIAVLRRSALAAAEDLIALSDRDPAAVGLDYALRSYRCFQAVLAYRLAHEIYLLGLSSQRTGQSKSLLTAARGLAERAKVDTGIEIHPAAEIGSRFVLDHGTGTVIGETVVIGNDCYLLQGVVLGAIGIADNPNGKRHPTLGNGVEVGAFAHVLGPICIGDGCVLHPHTVTTLSTPPNHRVRLITQCQVTHRDELISISGVRVCPRKLTVWGTGLSDVLPALAVDHGPLLLDVEQCTPTLLVALLPANMQATPDLLLLDAQSRSVRRAFIRLSHQWHEQQTQQCETCPRSGETS